MKCSCAFKAFKYGIEVSASSENMKIKDADSCNECIIRRAFVEDFYIGWGLFEYDHLRAIYRVYLHRILALCLAAEPHVCP